MDDTRNLIILSIFPGADLLGMAFQQEFDSCCVVHGPDVVFGQDIRGWHVPAGKFWGVIGGDPCQAHMQLSHLNRALGREPRFPDMSPEYIRIVEEAQPDWFLRENVPQASDIVVPGYVVHKLTVNNRWVGGVQHRERCFWFGSRDGRRLDVELVALEPYEWEYAVISGNGSVQTKIDRNGIPRTAQSIARMAAAAGRSWPRKCELQGLPLDWLQLSPFTAEGKKRLLANGVPLTLGRAIAKAVKRAMASTKTPSAVEAERMGE